MTTNDDPSRKRGLESFFSEGIVLICADDDAPVRLVYRGLARRLESVQGGVKECKILGATYKEASSLVSTVLGASQEHGDENVICVFDLHMENYDGQGEVLGSDVVRELRSSGFDGLAIIRTANEDDISKNMCHQAGADAVLNKRMSCGEVADAIMKHRAPPLKERSGKRMKESLEKGRSSERIDYRNYHTLLKQRHEPTSQ